MEKMIQYILQFGSLNTQQIDLVISKGQIFNLKKDDYFSEAGKIPRQVGFITQGVIRGCYYNNKGEEITRCFISENSLVCDYVNFEAQASSSEYLQAVTDCSLIIFSKKDWEELSRIIVEWTLLKIKWCSCACTRNQEKARLFLRMQPQDTWSLWKIILH